MLARLLVVGVVSSLRLQVACATEERGTSVSAPECPAGTKVAAKHLVLLANLPAGMELECRGANGPVTFAFAFNDRGRGESKVARYVIGDAGLPSTLEIDGHDGLNAPVRERFALTGDRAEWSNRGEHGSTLSAAGRFYFPLDGVPAGTALLARALSLNGGHLPLLPSGDARGERVVTTVVEVGGHSKEVSLHALTGLDFAPILVWLDVDGRLFATVGGWLQLVAEGWEPAVPRLLKLQEEWEGRRSRAQAARLARRPEHAVAITRARVFDAEAGVARTGWTVLFEKDHVLAAGPESEIQIPPDAERIDAAGRTLIPGLWDMHVHLGPNEGLIHLAAGVTSVRDLANERRILDELERRIAAGEALGPRVVRAGFIDGRGPNQGPVEAFATNADEVRALVRGYAADGYVLVKLYNSFDPALVPVAAQEAHLNGMRLGGHVPAGMDAERCVRAGYDEFQHILSLLWGFVGGADKTDQRVRVTAAANGASSIDLESPRVRALLRLLKERRTVIDPTLVLFESWLTARPSHVDPAYAAVVDRLPVQVRRSLFSGGLPVTPETDATYRRSFKTLQKLVAALYRQGSPLVAGTDSMPGFSLHRELELYVEAGLPPAEVLRMSTLDAARLAGRGHLLGSIAPGKLADMVLVEGDPSRRISDSRRVRLVVKGGLIHDPAALLAEVGALPAP